MTKFVAGCLEKRGYAVMLTYYVPYSLNPELSVPAFRLVGGSVGTREDRAFDRYPAYGIGAWLPELEFTHYLPTRLWRELMDGVDHFIVVSGNCLAALPFAMSGKPFLAWVATPWHGDRKDRVHSFPFHRKLLDRVINTPVLRAAERYILRRGKILALSAYTKRKLDTLSGTDVVSAVMPKGIDLSTFSPRPQEVTPGRIGFLGRFNDPRKNIALLIKALHECGKRHGHVHAWLIGAELDREAAELVRELGLEEAVRVVPFVEHRKLPRYLRTIDVFVIPSHQEGLCIAALEAMACGSPVISTQSGGPEEFVNDNETGYLVDENPCTMADAIVRVVTDRTLRNRLGANARRLVETKYSTVVAERIFWDAFEVTFSNTMAVTRDVRKKYGSRITDRGSRFTDH